MITIPNSLSYNLTKTTVYYTAKDGSYYVDMSYYESEYGYVVDVYVYYITETGSSGGGSDSGSGSGSGGSSTTDADLMMLF